MLFCMKMLLIILVLQGLNLALLGYSRRRLLVSNLALRHPLDQARDRLRQAKPGQGE